MIEDIFCKRIVFENILPGYRRDRTVLFGLIVEDGDFLIVETGKRMYRINKKLVLIVEDTNIPFEKVEK
jgi:hypothetical protein